MILNQDNLACLLARTPDPYQREMLVHGEDPLRAISTKITQLVNEKTQNQNKQREDLCCKCFELVLKNKWEKHNTQAHKARFFKRTLSLYGKSERFMLLWLVQFDWHNKMILQVKTAFCFTKWKVASSKWGGRTEGQNKWVIFLRQSHIRETFKESSSYSRAFERREKNKKKRKKGKIT